MKNEPTRYRAFTREFCEYMTGVAQWPTFKHLGAWMRSSPRGESIKNTRYTKMKKGASEQECYFRDLVAMLIDRGRGSIVPYYCEATRAYLGRKGIPPGTPLAVGAAIEALCTAPSDGPSLPTSQIDYWQFGFRALQKILHFDRVLRGPQLLPIERVPEAITWMFIDYGRQLAFPHTATPERAVALTEAMMHLTLAEYQARAVRWRRWNPWSMIGFRGEDKMIGMSLVLPLTPVARQRILDGEQMTYDCTRDQIPQHSHYLLHEGLAMRPPELAGDPAADMAAPYLAVFAQVAALSAFPALRSGSPLSILSIAGTPVNRERQAAFGYKPTGKRMRQTDIEFVERTIHRSLREGLTAALLDFVSRQIGDDPPPP